MATYDTDWDRKLKALTKYLMERTTMTEEEATAEARRQLLVEAAEREKRRCR